jgi:glycosyltransferase involved in cell wall biosynthesis
MNVPILSVVMPTHNRAHRVERACQRLLDDPAVGELIVVADGCVDDTLARLGSFGSDRLFVLSNSPARGPEVARNMGARKASGDWLAFVDDDDEFPCGFFDALLRIGVEANADLVAAPWIHVAEGQDPQSHADQAPRTSNGPTARASGVFPVAPWVECVWGHTNFVVRRRFAEQCEFNEGLRGNYWRDETDFAVSVARAGGRVVVTNTTYSYMRAHSRIGGIDRASALKYEWYVLRNEVIFLRRHGSWLREKGYISGSTSFLLNTLLHRIRNLFVGFVRSRIRNNG